MENSRSLMVNKYSHKQLLRLIRRVQKQIPENDTSRHGLRQMEIDWQKVAFGPLDWKECQRVSMLLVRKVQRLQTLPDLLETAKEAITKLKEVKDNQKKSALSTMSKSMARAYKSYFRKKLRGVPVDQKKHVRNIGMSEWIAMSPDEQLSYLPKTKGRNEGPRSPPKTLYNFFVGRFLKGLDLAIDRKEKLVQAANAWRELSEEEKMEQQRLWEKAQRHHAKRYQAFLESLAPEEREAMLELETRKGASTEENLKQRKLKTEVRKEYLEEKKKMRELVRTRPPKTLYQYFIRRFFKAQAGKLQSNEMFKAASQAWKETSEDERARLKRRMEKLVHRYTRRHANYLKVFHEQKEKIDQLQKRLSEITNGAMDLSNSVAQGDAADLTVDPVDEDFDTLDHTTNETKKEQMKTKGTPVQRTRKVATKKEKSLQRKIKTEAQKEYLEEKKKMRELVRNRPPKPPKTLYHYFIKRFFKAKDGELPPNEMLKAASKAWKETSEDERVRLKRQMEKLENRYMRIHAIYLNDFYEQKEKLDQLEKRLSEDTNGAMNLSTSLQTEVDHQVMADLTFEDLSPKKKKRRNSHNFGQNNLENSDSIRTDPEQHPATFSASPIKAMKKKGMEEDTYQENCIEIDTSLQTEVDRQVMADPTFEDLSPKKKKRRNSHYFDQNNLENSDSIRTDPKQHPASFSASPLKAKKKKGMEEDTYQENCIENDTSLQTEDDGQVMADLIFEDFSPKKKKRRNSGYSEEKNLQNSDGIKAKKKKRLEEETYQENSIENYTSYNEKNENHIPLEAPVEPPKTPMHLFLLNPGMTEQDWIELPEKKKKDYKKALKRLQQTFLVKYQSYLEVLPRENLAEHMLKISNDSCQS